MQCLKESKLFPEIFGGNIGKNIDLDVAADGVFMIYYDPNTQRWITLIDYC